jgi:hypothetical protein
MYNLTSEYFVILSHPDFYCEVRGIWVNPAQELGNDTHPTYRITARDFEGDVGAREIYRYDQNEITSDSAYFIVGKLVHVSWIIYPPAVIPTETTVVVTGDDGQVITSNTVTSTNSGGALFTMPK